jgi:hypothetical protein
VQGVSYILLKFLVIQTFLDFDYESLVCIVGAVQVLPWYSSSSVFPTMKFLYMIFSLFV